tara:strand:+ start:3099 stop:3410 length:312 start_codon:yes stop_codon:yes gene_type:complete
MKKQIANKHYCVNTTIIIHREFIVLAPTAKEARKNAEILSKKHQVTKQEHDNAVIMDNDTSTDLIRKNKAVWASSRNYYSNDESLVPIADAINAEEYRYLTTP